MEYPVLTGAVMWADRAAGAVQRRAARTASPLVLRHQRDRARALRAAVAVGATVALAGRRPWDAAMFALAPGLALAGTINWDLYAVALLALGMLAWARERPVAAGVLIGLAAATKFYPLFVLGPLLVLCLRAGRMREFWATLRGRRSCAWLAVNVPVMLADFDGWSKFYRLSARTAASASARSGSCCRSRATRCPTSQLNVLAGGLFAVACLGDRGAGAVGPAPAPAAAAGVPRRGGLPADQQGVLAAVRAVADPAGRAGPAALAGLPDLAGRRGRALRRHLAAARGLPAGAAGAGPRRRRLRPHRARRTCWPRCGCARWSSATSCARSTTRSAVSADGEPTTTRPAASSTAPTTPGASSAPDPSGPP